MDFLILRPLSPKTGYHFFEVGGGGASKVFAQKAPSSGEAYRCHTKCRWNGNADDCKFLGRRFESWSVTVVGGGGAIFAQLVFKPPTIKTLVSCITIRPLLAVSQMFSPLLGAAAATDKKPKLLTDGWSCGFQSLIIAKQVVEHRGTFSNVPLVPMGAGFVDYVLSIVNADRAVRLVQAPGDDVEGVTELSSLPESPPQHPS